MILTIDVGNTNITCGVFQGDEIAASFRITTKMPRTSDEYGMMLMNLLEQNDIHPTEIKDAHHLFRCAECDAFPEGWTCQIFPYHTDRGGGGHQNGNPHRDTESAADRS